MISKSDIDAESAPAETAHYIAGMAKELRGLAAKAQLGFLAYLLAMVEQDAGEMARRLSKGKL